MSHKIQLDLFQEEDEISLLRKELKELSLLNKNESNAPSMYVIMIFPAFVCN